MKKVTFVLSLMVLMALPVQGQYLSNAIRNSVEKFTPGKVTFKDGHETAYMWIVIPGDGDSKVKVSNDPKHQKKEEIDADEVVSVTLWSENFPDKMSTLYYVHADKSPHFAMMFPAPTHAWGYPIASSSWGTIYRCCPIYSIDKKTGEMMEEHYQSSSTMGNMRTVQNVPAFCYLVCENFEHAQHIGSSPAGSHSMVFANMWNPKKLTSPLFAENPAIANAIGEKVLTGRDIQFILDEMASGFTTEEDIELYVETVNKAINKAKAERKNKKNKKDKTVKKDTKSNEEKASKKDSNSNKQKASKKKSTNKKKSSNKKKSNSKSKK